MFSPSGGGGMAPFGLLLRSATAFFQLDPKVTVTTLDSSKHCRSYGLSAYDVEDQIQMHYELWLCYLYLMCVYSYKMHWVIAHTLKSCEVKVDYNLIM